MPLATTLRWRRRSGRREQGARHLREPREHRHRKALEVLDDVLRAQRLPARRDFNSFEAAPEERRCIVALSK